eukprot:TRINITY_DN627_c0_g1_i1.p1 TRINITY_DN627_c0_g1~~TRINITY_DN627_c0_g1_i1.p1  ORF type:complete len:281 (-),score=51.55 TRINITY_DN627_c0_g1_i1:80-922(-)
MNKGSLAFLLLLCIGCSSVFAEDIKFDDSGIPAEYQKYITYGINITLIVVALLFVFAGYRLVYVMLFLIGFLAFFGISYTLVPQLEFAANNIWITLGISAGAGLIGGFLFLCVFYIGIFFVGAILGLVIGSILLLTPISEYVVDIYAILFVGGFALVFGIIACIFQKPLIIIATAFSGSYQLGLAIDNLLLHSNFHRVFLALFSALSQQGQTISELIKGQEAEIYGMMAGILVLSIIGMAFQFGVSGRQYNHNKRKSDNPYDGYHAVDMRGVDSFNSRYP